MTTMHPALRSEWLRSVRIGLHLGWIHPPAPQPDGLDAYREKRRAQVRESMRRNRERSKTI